MKTQLIYLFSAAAILTLGACANKPTQVDPAKLEKFPQCYNKNIKLANTCISKNEAGENVTAMQLENEAYPGQYK